MGANDADGIILTGNDLPILREHAAGTGSLLSGVRAVHSDAGHTR
jgi:hypothetical protein